MLTKDIHSNKETVPTALYELEQGIKLAKARKEKVLCLIVGYGSKGTAHKIQTAVLLQLEEYKSKRMIKEYIRGNELDIFNSNYQKLKFGHLINENEKKEKNYGKIYVIV